MTLGSFAPRTRIVWATLLLAAASSEIAGAQQRDTVSGDNTLPRDVAREVVALFNATVTLRATDQLDIERGRTVTGDVAVLHGPVIIAGHITGRVLADRKSVV